ncbi:hypothetical protein OROGR_032253 [Orobanche gracilis]
MKKIKMDTKRIEELKSFVDHCKQNPTVLHDPPFAFFKNFLQSLGAQIPPSGKMDKGEDGEYHRDGNVSRDDDIGNEDIIESDIELDNSDVLEPDNDPPQVMGNSSIEVTEENEEAAQLSKAKAMDLITDGMFHEAIYHLTEAITLNPKSAILYANRALQAVFDLRVAAKLDFDEEIGSVLKKVEPNAKKIESHRLKYERLRKEEELRKIELEKQRRQVKSETQDSEAATLLKDGEINLVRSERELETNMVRSLSSHFSRFVSLAANYERVVFLKVDIDESRSAAAEWNVSSVPSFFFVKDGKEVDKLVGADKKLLEMKITQHAVKSGHFINLIPAWNKAFRNLSEKVKLGSVDCGVEKSLTEKFEVKQYPTILVFCVDKNTSVLYMGRRTFSAIKSFALGELEKYFVPLEVTGKEFWDKKCVSVTFYFVAFLPNILDSKANGQNMYLRQLMSVAEELKDYRAMEEDRRDCGIRGKGKKSRYHMKEKQR